VVAHFKMSLLASVYLSSREVKPAENVRDIDTVMRSESTYDVKWNERLPIWCAGSGFWSRKPVVTGRYWDTTCFFEVYTGHSDSSGNASGVYSEGVWLESRAVYTVLTSTLAQILVLPYCIMEHGRIILQSWVWYFALNSRFTLSLRNVVVVRISIFHPKLQPCNMGVFTALLIFPW
jgi:hypothetical protein